MICKYWKPHDCRIRNLAEIHYSRSYFVTCFTKPFCNNQRQFCSCLFVPFNVTDLRQLTTTRPIDFHRLIGVWLCDYFGIFLINRLTHHPITGSATSQMQMR